VQGADQLVLDTSHLAIRTVSVDGETTSAWELADRVRIALE
jgi:aminopeptidase N